MADKNKSWSLFGFKIGKPEDEQVNMPSFVPPSNEDGAFTVTSAAQFGTSAIDMDVTAKNEIELITRYREMAMQPEIEAAIDDIVNEAIVHDDNGKSVEIIMDNLNQPDKIKKAINDEFLVILRLLNFNKMGSDIFRRFYIDGRLNYHAMVDIDNPRDGIKELRYIDPRKIRKIREVKKQKDPNTNVEVIVSSQEYYVYSERMLSTSTSAISATSTTMTGIKVAPDSILNVNCGLMDAKRGMVLSYLHKAIKPLNQLRMIEDAVVIYRISRAPERRIFYIDVGNLPRVKAEQYVRDVMTKYKNKLVYDAQTGEVRDDRRHLSMLEDFWMPRRSDGKSTEITTLQSGQNLSHLEDVDYFEKKLYKSLNVPVTRLDPSQATSIGRSTEITRDELKFSKFIDKLRTKFTDLFDQALRIQLVLKGVCTEEEWAIFKESISYDFIKDNNFVELKEAELMQERLGILAIIDQFAGKYYSQKWISENVLRLNDLEIDEMQKEIEDESADSFKKQTEDQQKQIMLQAQLAELQAKAMPQDIQGQQPEQSQPAQEQPPIIDTSAGQNAAQPNNPYKINSK